MKIRRCVKRNPLKNLRVMAKLNPYAKTLKVVRKKELADLLAVKKSRIAKVKELHKTQKAKAKKSPGKKSAK